MKKFLSNVVLSIMIIAILILLLVYSKDASETIKYCIEVCTNTLIPSIFAYMTLCSFLINSGLSIVITTPLWYISKRFIKLDKITFSVFILSLIAGYPVGIKMLKQLISHNKNYTEIAIRIAPVCFASGPAFIIGFAGNTIYDSSTAGIIIFISCTVSNLIGAVILTKNTKLINATYKEQLKTSGKDITNVILSSAKSMLMVCLSMILFNIIAMLIYCALPEHISSNEVFRLFKAIIEITNIHALDATVPLWLMTFFISFGGLCVIFQVFLLSDGELKIKRFILMRTILSALSALICVIITEISGFEPSIPTFFEKKSELLLDNPFVLISVAVMTIFLISLMSEDVKKFKKNKIIFKKD